MGRSKSSCLKILTCARGDSVVEDPVAVASSPESKISSDKRRWSFRKRSYDRQVPANTVISEPVCVSYGMENKEISATNLLSPRSSCVSEKAPQKDFPNEIPPVSSILNKPESISLPDHDENSNVTDDGIQESAVLMIQASIRGYLVRREFLKVKNVIKLQAAIRGHLVRRQAVGTLRCVQAIIKLQALVRARRSNMLPKKFEEQVNKKFQGKRNSCVKSNRRYNSNKSLLSNGFACQLLESTPKTKPIYIDCDPSKCHSAWKWLERWMAVAVSEEQEEEKISQGCQGLEVGGDERLAGLSVSSDSKLAVCGSTMLTENEMHLLTKSDGSCVVVELHDPTINPISFDSVRKDDHDKSRLENEAVDVKQEKDIEAKARTEKSISPMSQMTLQTDESEVICDSTSGKPRSDSSLEQHNMKALSESMDGEEFVRGSKPDNNSVFSIGQSKFEDLISTSAGCRTIDSFQVARADSRLGNERLLIDSPKKSGDLIFGENSFSYAPVVQVAASECGTEISISSTLDSPDKSEADGGEIVLELGSVEKPKYHGNGGSPVKFNPGDTEATSPSFQEEVLQSDRMEECNQNLANSIISSDAVQAQQLEENTAYTVQSGIEISINQQIDRESLEGTPRSHAITAEFHGTPSQNSVSVKKNKKESKRPDGKVVFQIGKKSPSNLTRDSGGKSSGEQLQKDSKSSKRRDSLGMDRQDQVDLDPARVSISNSLPSYMQATESARAKAHLSTSPKSSPDLHNKDNHMKKRHSLPNSNGKHGSSPRMQRSTSQTDQSPKGNGIRSPHNSAERKWQR